MKKFLKILSDIALVIGIISFIISLIRLIVSQTFQLGIFEIILFSSLLIFFVFSRNKKESWVDVTIVLDFIYDMFF